MSTANIDELLSAESSDEEEANDTLSSIDDNYYHHISGPFSRNDGSYRHRHDSSPKHGPSNLSKKKLRYSWSTPDFSIYSQPLKPKIPTQSIDLLQSDRYQQILRSIITADVPILPKSFILCPHKHHCFQNAIMKGFFRTFSAAFIFKTCLKFFTKLFAGKLSFKQIKAIYLDQDSILFGLFVGLMSFTYKAILCTLRRIRKKDPIYHKTIAGFFSALWILIDDKQRRQQIALYCLVRAVSDMFKLGVEYKKIPIIPHADIGVFTLSQLFIMHGLVHATHALDHRYYKWIKNMGNLTEAQCQLSFRSRINPKLQWRLPSEQWAPCYPIFHADHSCVRHHSIDWLYGLVRAARIYVPVHVLPTILFEPKRVFKEPMTWLQRKAYNVMISSVFLTTYQFNMKMSLCVLRNWFQEDRAWHGVFGGFCAGLALFIENQYRRPELMLYCVPRAMEVAFRLIPNKSHWMYLYRTLRCVYLPVFSFQIAMSLWMTVIAIPKGTDTSNSINMTVLKIIFGSKH